MSDDPAVDPRVEFRLLSDPRDATRMRLAAQELFAVLGSEAVRTLTSTITLDESGPTPDDLANAAALDAPDGRPFPASMGPGVVAARAPAHVPARWG